MNGAGYGFDSRIRIRDALLVVFVNELFFIFNCRYMLDFMSTGQLLSILRVGLLCDRFCRVGLFIFLGRVWPHDMQLCRRLDVHFNAVDSIYFDGGTLLRAFP